MYEAINYCVTHCYKSERKILKIFNVSWWFFKNLIIMYSYWGLPLCAIDSRFVDPSLIPHAQFFAFKKPKMTSINFTYVNFGTSIALYKKIEYFNSLEYDNSIYWWITLICGIYSLMPVTNHLVTKKSLIISVVRVRY